jgi:TctA family transporter
MHDPSVSIARLSSEILPGSRRVRETYRALIRSGFLATEAANLVAYLEGLRVADASWTVNEVTRILFLRHLYRSDRLSHA